MLLVSSELLRKRGWKMTEKLRFVLLPDELITMQQSIQWELWRMDHDLADAAAKLSRKDLAGEETRRILKELASPYTNVIDAAATNARGIMKAMEPVKQALEGSDISQQAHIKKLHATRQPVLSRGFAAVEGYQAVALEWPIFNQDNQLAGSVSLLIKPELFASLQENKGLKSEKFLIMETDGLILFDSQKEQTGQNTLADIINRTNPELFKLAPKIAKNKSGTASYTLVEAAQKEVAKRTDWTTVGLHGKEWRLIQNYSVRD